MAESPPSLSLLRLRYRSRFVSLSSPSSRLRRLAIVFAIVSIVSPSPPSSRLRRHIATVSYSLSSLHRRYCPLAPRIPSLPFATGSQTPSTNITGPHSNPLVLYSGPWSAPPRNEQVTGILVVAHWSKMVVGVLGTRDYIYNYCLRREHLCKCKINQEHLKRLFPLQTGINLFFGLQLLVLETAWIPRTQSGILA